MNAVTQLFLMYEKPVREGVYKLARIDGIAAIWSYWNGMRWCSACYSVEQAFGYGKIGGLPDRSPGIIGWRGLAEDPNA